MRRAVVTAVTCLSIALLGCPGGDSEPGTASGEASESSVGGPPPLPPAPSARVIPKLIYDRPLQLALAHGPELDGAELTRTLQQRWGLQLAVHTVALAEHKLPDLAPLFEERVALEALPATARQALARMDGVLFAARVDGELRLRHWHPDVDDWSPVWSQPGARPVDACREASEDLIGWSGLVIKVGDRAPAKIGGGARVTVALRGSGLLLDRASPIKAGQLGRFDFRLRRGRYTRERCLGIVDAVAPSGDGVHLELTTYGGYAPRVGDRWRAVWVPAGERQLRVVSTSGRPEPGMVVYASAEGFQRGHGAYVGTTDVEGKVTLKGAGPAFVMVVSAVEQVEFVFFQRLVPIGRGLPGLRVSIDDENEELVEKARAIQKRRMSAEEMLAVKRQVIARTDAATELARAGRYADAVKRCDEALRLLEGVENKGAESIRKATSRQRETFATAHKKQLAMTAEEDARAAISRADEAVFSGRFAEAVLVLSDAASKFPAKLFPVRSKQISDKLSNARRLVREQSSPLGRARKAALAFAASVGSGEIADAAFDELEAAVDTVVSQGVHDSRILYSDTELLSQLKLRLNQAAEVITAQEKQVKERYDKIVDAAERQKLSERADALYNSRTRIDRILSKLPAGD